MGLRGEIEFYIGLSNEAVYEKVVVLNITYNVGHLGFSSRLGLSVYYTPNSIPTLGPHKRSVAR